MLIIIATKTLTCNLKCCSNWLMRSSLGLVDMLQLSSLSLPDHWVRQLFMAHAYLELQLNEEGLAIYQTFLATGFSKSNYIVSQIAVAYHNMRGRIQYYICCQTLCIFFSHFQSFDFTCVVWRLLFHLWRHVHGGCCCSFVVEVRDITSMPWYEIILNTYHYKFESMVYCVFQNHAKFYISDKSYWNWEIWNCFLWM